MAQFSHACEQAKGVEPAHSDSLIFGRGIGHKTPDWAYAALCHPAHLMLDTFPRDAKRIEWLRAFVATQNWLWINNKIGVVK